MPDQVRNFLHGGLTRCVAFNYIRNEFAFNLVKNLYKKCKVFFVQYITAK